MGNGQWAMGNGQWQVAGGRWQVAGGRTCSIQEVTAVAHHAVSKPEPVDKLLPTREAFLFDHSAVFDNFPAMDNPSGVL
jgi:hypothetical protein